MDDVRTEMMKSARGPGDNQLKKMTDIQTTLRVQGGHLKEAELRAQEVLKSI